MINARFTRSVRLLAALLLLGCRARGPVPPADAGAERAAPARAATLDGVVHDRKGAPVPAARVLCWPAVGDGVVREVRTGADGRFVLPSLRDGKHQLMVEAQGFDSLSEVAVPGKSLELTLQGETRSISGTVRLKGVPVGDARVLLGELERAAREVRTAPDGSFSFHGLGPGSYRLRAARGQHVSGTQVVPLDTVAQPPPVQVDLGPGAIVSGSAVDDVGGVVAAAEITMESIPADGLPETTLANEEGQWAIGPLPPGEFLVSARRAGYLQGDAGRLTLKPATGRARQNVTLIRAARVRGRLLGPDGRPVARQTVRVLRGGSSELGVVLGALPLAAEAASLPTARVPQSGRARSASSDELGRFELADLAPGKAAVDISPPGKLAMHTSAVLEPGKVLDMGDLVLRDGITVTGHVYDQAGIPQAARVTGRPRAAGIEPTFADTDGHGQFTLQVAPGDLELVVSAAGMSTETVPLTARAEDPPAPVAVRLVRADVAVDGLVKDALGRPVGGARVIARPMGAGADGISWGSAVTDPGGHFRLTGLPRRDLRVEASHALYPATSVPLAQGGGLTIVLPVPGGIAGEVREWGAGAPVTTWIIDAHGPEGRTATPTRGAAGAFTLARLAPGAWTLSVRAPGYQSTEQTITVPAASNLGELSVRDVRVELRR